MNPRGDDYQAGKPLPHKTGENRSGAQKFLILYYPFGM
jgi:hypothetical protein